MNDQTWVRVGKISAFLVVVIGLVSGVLNLYDRVAGPSLEGTVQMVQPATTPIFKKLAANADLQRRILTDIERRRGIGEHADVILAAVEAGLREGALPMNDSLGAVLELAAPPRNLDLTIWNHGGDVARNVEVMLAGNGTAQISDEILSTDKLPFIRWSRSVPLGDMAPGAIKTVRIWNDNIFAYDYDPPPALVFAKGAGKLHQSRQFFGWDADLVAWFLGQSRLFRVGVCVVVLLTVVLALFWLKHRGYVRFRRQTNT